MLKISKKWVYALKAVFYVSQTKEVYTVSNIAKTQKISESLLRRIIADLEKSWVLKTIKWRNWWVMLWKEKNKISIYDILFSVWEDLWISDCTKGIMCTNHETCLTTNFFGSLQTWFNSLLKINTLDKIDCSQKKEIL